MRIFMLTMVVLCSSVSAGASDGPWMAEPGPLAFPNSGFCQSIAASDGAETVVCGGEETLVFEKFGDDWWVFSDPLPKAETVDICFEGDRLAVATDTFGAQVYERRDAGTANRNDDSWEVIANFDGGSSVSIARGFNCNTIIVGDSVSKQATIYNISTGSAIRTLDGYKPVAAGASGANFAATDPETQTVYYTAGATNGPQQELTGPAGSEFGAALSFGSLGSIYLFVGAPMAESSEGDPVGACFLYLQDGSFESGWEFTFFDKFNPPDTLAPNSRFCQSVSTWTGPGAVVGAPMADFGCLEENPDCNSGSAFLFSYKTDTADIVRRYDSPDPNPAGNQFGAHIFVQRVGPSQGEYILIGEPFWDKDVPDAGRAVIYRYHPVIFRDGFESGDTCAWANPNTCPKG